MQQKKGIFLILLAGCLWGMMGIFVRWMDRLNMSSLEIVALRAIVTTFFIFIGLFIYDRSMLKIKLRDLWCFLGTGLCSIVFFNYCYFKAMTLTSLSVAAVLLYTAPIIVMIMSLFLFKEKFTLNKVIAAVAAFAGCAFVSGVFESGQSVTFKGILMGLGAGFGYALYSIFGRYAIERGYNSFTITAYTFLIASIGVIFLIDVKEFTSKIAAAPVQILMSVILILIITLVPYITYTLGLKYVETGRASVMASVEPVVASLIGVFIYKESISISGVVGIVLVLSSIVLLNSKRGEKIKK